ncbi:uncharacterized membrane protein HdeD (DUF308 family) [Lipingzhangella halophila]|uniref:Uncharacterized membrane protein HdeD (DUF308 family) n=1 Tax=Lipingzhangella halophila TaxID=1783352 RepID=A0A7W7W1Z7_9ACTN|nr:GPGG-motif small membrane protein [Lipingzhangella halophila]MBB4931497.1 uncharacterized membrane protein HdeD (DUF308 family) [Lipingzhangella halophila]
MGILMVFVGVVLVVAGVLAVFRTHTLWGTVLVVVGLIVTSGVNYFGL